VEVPRWWPGGDGSGGAIYLREGYMLATNSRSGAILSSVAPVDPAMADFTASRRASVAIFNLNSSSRFVNCVITNNSAAQGGGIYSWAM